VAAVLAVLPFAFAAWAQDTVALEVGTVLATNSSSQIDAELAGIRGQLERLFPVLVLPSGEAGAERRQLWQAGELRDPRRTPPAGDGEGHHGGRVP